MSKSENLLNRVRQLEDEVMAIAIEFGKHPTYHNAVKMQCRQTEREVIIEELRSKIRVVVDNSEFWG